MAQGGRLIYDETAAISWTKTHLYFLNVILNLLVMLVFSGASANNTWA